MAYTEFVQLKGYKELPIGQLYVQDELCLYNNARGNVAEIGCLCGRSASIMSMVADKVTTIDIFDNYDLIKDELQREHYKDLSKTFLHDYKSIKDNLSKYSNINVICGTSDELPKICEKNNEKFDFIFIDGDHSYEGVKYDYINARKSIKKGGIIAFHDSNVKEPGMGVYQLMAELKRDRGVVLTPQDGVITLCKTL